MLYTVLHQGIVIKSTTLFVDAWLFAKTLSSWSSIVGADGEWIVNPFNSN